MSKWYAQVSWDEVAHLSAKDKSDLFATLPPYQREARSKGIPSLGSGLIYPIKESDIVIADFPIPDHYKRAWALDVGWNSTAVVWVAQDPDTKVAYLYSCYKRGQAEPETHVKAIKARGEWIPGVGDVAGVNQTDGRQMMSIYRDDHGLNLTLPNKTVEAGIYKVWTLFMNGSLKVFASLIPWFDEFRFYARDDKGRVVKKDDHLMDCTRYLIMSGLERAKPKPVEKPTEELSHLDRFVTADSLSSGLMGI
jgi:hypothetical protein